MDTLGPAARRNAAGFSSIEFAIVLIAVIVVGSITAVATVWAGGFAAREGKGTVDAALANATDNVALRGSVLAMGGSVDVDGDDSIDLDGADEQAVVQVKFVLSGVADGVSIDLTPPNTADDTGTDPDASGLESDTVISVRHIDLSEEEAAWTVAFIGGGGGDYMLETGERAEVTVWLNSYDNVNQVWDLGSDGDDPYADSATELLQTNTEFGLELYLTSGGVFALRRVTPPLIETSMDLR